MRFREALGLGAVSAEAAFDVSPPPPGHMLSHEDMRIKNIQADSRVHPVDNKNRAVMRIKSIQGRLWVHPVDNKNRAVKRIKNIQADSQVPTLG